MRYGVVMNGKTLQRLSGLAGVASHEHVRARRWAGRFEALLLLVVFWIPLQWYLEVRGLISPSASAVADWLVWGLFVAETAVLTLLVKNKGYYLRHNWMNMVIISAGLPLAWNITPLAGLLRSLRLLLLVSLIFRLSRSLRDILARNRLGATLGVSLGVILLAGVLMAAIDPAVETPLEGIWWAWVTVTTVGYGDIVPSSGAGRLFGALLILLGVALFALLTASFSAFFLQRDINKVERDIERDVDRVEQEEEDIKSSLKRLNLTLSRIEQRLESLEKRVGREDDEFRR